MMNLRSHCRRDDAWKKEQSRSRRKGTSIPHGWVIVTITLLLVFGACTTFASPISSSSMELAPAIISSSLTTTTPTASTESDVQDLFVPENTLLAAALADSGSPEPSPTPVLQPSSLDSATTDIPPLEVSALPISLASSSSNSSTNGTTGPITGGGSAGDDANAPLILNVGQKTQITSENVGLGVVFLIFGLVQVFYGFKFIRLTLFIMGFLSCAVIAILVMVSLNWQLNFYVFKPSHYVFWVWFPVALVGGIICFRFWDLGVTFAGAFGGFAIAMAIVAASDRHLSTTWRYVILVALVLLCAALATMFERVAVILCTSFGGSYMFMYGLDEFLQVGYREMIVIFQFTGRSLTYHPNKQVFDMLGGSLGLALLGVAWEFWHHETPILMDRKALFRIYGRPFGKRPEKLVGEKLTSKTMDWCTYLTSCICLRHNSVEDVLNQPMRDDFVVVIGAKSEQDARKQQARAQHHSSISTVQGSEVASSESGEQLAVGGTSLSSKTASLQGDDHEEPNEKTESPVKVFIEEGDYQVEGDGMALVVLGTHVESAVATTTSSNTISGHHHSSSSMTATRTVMHSSSSTTTRTTESHTTSGITAIVDSTTTSSP